MKIIKKIYARYVLWRYERDIERLTNTTLLIIRVGNVRQIQTIAGYWKQIGENFEMPEVIQTGERLRDNAENIVLSRVFK